MPAGAEETDCMREMIIALLAVIWVKAKLGMPDVPTLEEAEEALTEVVVDYLESIDG